MRGDGDDDDDDDDDTDDDDNVLVARLTMGMGGLRLSRCTERSKLMGRNAVNRVRPPENGRE